MPVKHAVLGLLLERRSYGYELVQRLTERLGPAWQLTPSGVYWALDQLERAGQIEAALHHGSAPADEPLSRRARRVVYTITPAGKQAFLRWLTRPTGQPEPVRAEMHLKIAVAQPMDIAAVAALVSYEEALLRRLQIECEPSPGDEARTRLVRAGAASRLAADLTWLQQVRATLEDSCAGRRLSGAPLRPSARARW
jgi:DNA-binding PadR family transcriptional regulator